MDYDEDPPEYPYLLANVPYSTQYEIREEREAVSEIYSVFQSEFRKSGGIFTKGVNRFRTNFLVARARYMEHVAYVMSASNSYTVMVNLTVVQKDVTFEVASGLARESARTNPDQRVIHTATGYAVDCLTGMPIPIQPWEKF